jgi:hypothetical protein
MGVFARRSLLRSTQAQVPSSQQIVESSPTPLAVVNGEEGHLLTLDYFDSINYANLWDKHCYRLAGLGHAPFWESPGSVQPSA